MSFTDEERRTYCAHRSVRARVRDFFGHDRRGDPLALYLAVGNENASRHREALPIEELASWLDRGVEINRSLWDRESLVCHLDVEYVNFDQPWQPFLNPEHAFALQEPVVAAVSSGLASFGIAPLKLMTGRGYHFIWRLSRKSRAFTLLASIGHVSASLRHLYATEHAPTGEQVAPELGAAFAGLGCVMEFLAHQVKARGGPQCTVPLELAAIEAAPGPRGREMISVDITEYADPLSARVVRTPFSVYLKAAQQHQAIGDDIVGQLPPILVIPMGRFTVAEALQIRSDPSAVAHLAAESSVDIPDESSGMKRLIAAYRESRLAAFHLDFYAQEHDARGLWPETYDRTPLEALPPCARFILEHPNDLLLRPGCAQRVVRVMLALGWHPRHIAGLIRSKYERDFGWCDQWRGFDPATRADFYARVFAGLFVAGVDELIDFNCQSGREQGICFIESCPQNLIHYRNSLIERRHHERLACRPFNRLFLPAEHL